MKYLEIQYIDINSDKEFGNKKGSQFDVQISYLGQTPNRCTKQQSAVFIHTYIHTCQAGKECQLPIGDTLCPKNREPLRIIRKQLLGPAHSSTNFRYTNSAKEK